MRRVEDNEITLIAGGDTISDIISQVRTYYNDVEQSAKLPFALGGATASIVCMVGLPVPVSFGIFSIYALYLKAF